jgi:hypothetical protein
LGSVRGGSRKHPGLIQAAAAEIISWFEFQHEAR